MEESKTLLFRQFFEQIPESVFICNEEGVILYINQRGSEMVGVLSETPEVRISSFDVSLVDCDDWRKLLLEVKALETVTYQTAYSHLSQDIELPVEVNARYVPDEDSGYLIVSARDIKKRREAEQALAHIQAVTEQSSKLSRVGGWDLDLINQKLYWTEMTKEIHEVPQDFEPDFSSGLKFYKEGPTREMMKTDMLAAIQHGAPLGVAEVELVTAKGRTIWVRCVGEVVRKNGKAVRVYGSIQDIDEQKRIELKLEQSLNLLENLTRNIPGAVFQLEMLPDSSLNCNFVSGGIRDLFPESDLPDSGKINEFLLDFVHPADVPWVIKALRESAQTLEPIEIDFRRREKPVRNFHANARAELRNGGGVAWHGYVHDNTDMIKRREELKRFAEMTSEQNKRLINFTYIVSHNIRSHVANLLGIIDILKSDDVKARETFIPLMKESVQSLDESLKNLNDIVNIQTQVDLISKPINLRQSVEKTLLNLKLAIKEANAQVHNYVPEEFILNTNAAYLDSILLNLLSNAVKYRSPERSSVVEVSVENNGRETILVVSDNGLGIDIERYRNVLFGMYKTFHKNKDAKGLGLFITKTQVEALGGKIDLESEVNKGTIVRVYFYE